jgi:hypothetical protein
VYDCTTGIEADSGVQGIQNSFNNNYFLNTTAFSANWYSDPSDITTDPDFVDEAGGDYTPQSVEAVSGGMGFNEWPVGAFGADAAVTGGSGGGLITHPGMTGGING